MTFAYNPFRAVEFLSIRLLTEVEQEQRFQRKPEIVKQDMSATATSTTASTVADVTEGDIGNELMLALQAGDSSALQSLFALYNPRLYNFTLRIVNDPVVAEDLVQETWLSLYESKHRYRSTHRFSTWLFTIARRKALSELRRRKVRSVVRSLTGRRDGQEEATVEVPQHTYRSPEAEASGAVLSELIQIALDRLTPAQREIIVLRDIEGLENEEIAEVLGWNLKPGAIRKRVFDARAAIRKEIIALGAVEEDVDMAVQ